MEQGASALLTLNRNDAAFLCAKLSEAGSKNAVLCQVASVRCVCACVGGWEGQRLSSISFI